MALSPGQDAALPALTGLVLAGGRGRRLGRDKALVEVAGEPLVVRAARRLEQCCQAVFVASGDGRRLGELAWEQVADAVSEGGPLAGILAGLERATTPLVAVVAVDLPHLNPAVLQRLAGEWRGEAAVV
ncbi:MAG: NTP transferase domain-containing protein, partial [Actinomycetota bacterium]|nr:NTP transferase domain-containing protein [Actinomycetota bacterium]